METKKSVKKIKKQHRYQKGHKYYVPFSKHPQNEAEDTSGQWVLPRLTEEEHHKVVRAGPSEVLSTGSRLLRPRKGRKDDITEEYLQEGEETGEMRLLHNKKMALMWNSCIREHALGDNADCKIPEFIVDREEQRGLCWRQSLRCVFCNYRSEMFTLYDEVPSAARGRKSAAPNLGLQVGLLNAPVGNTKARLLMAATNTPPPSRSAMQGSSNRAAIITSEEAELDLHERREELKKINVLRGLPESSPIDVSVDVRYNSQTIAGRGKWGQTATQATGMMIENHTDQHQIIGVYVENKLCYTGAWLRGKGFNVTCPGGHIDCTATRAAAEPFSEYDIGKKLGSELAMQGILLKYVTTDGDGHSAEGIESSMKEIDPLWQVIRQADTTHLGQGQFRHTIKATFSKQMFPGATTTEQKDQQKLLALDLKYRCTSIYKNLFKAHTGCMHKIAQQMPTVIEVTLDCYLGDCSNCKKQSVVCCGVKGKNWWNTSPYLRQLGCTRLNATEDDRKLLREVIKLKLGSASLKLMQNNTNTNKNESANRALSVSLPKNVHHSRTAKARALATVSRLNRGIGDSLVRSLEAVGSPISRRGRVAKAVRRMQLDSYYQRRYSKRKHVIAARLQRKARQMAEYFRAKKRRALSDYRKGQLDPTPGPSQKRRQIDRPDHNYAEPPYTRKNDHTYNRVISTKLPVTK